MKAKEKNKYYIAQFVSKCDQKLFKSFTHIAYMVLVRSSKKFHCSIVKLSEKKETGTALGKRKK